MKDEQIRQTDRQPTTTKVSFSRTLKGNNGIFNVKMIIFSKKGQKIRMDLVFLGGVEDHFWTPRDEINLLNKIRR